MIVLEGKERGLVTACDKSVLLHDDSFLLPLDYVLLRVHHQITNKHEDGH